MDVSFNAYYDDLNSLSTSSVGAGILIGSDSKSGIETPLGNGDLNDHEIHQFNAVPYALNFELIAELDGTGLNMIDLDGGLQVTPVPEPSTYAMFGMAFVGLGIVGYRKRRAA